MKKITFQTKPYSSLAEEVRHQQCLICTYSNEHSKAKNVKYGRQKAPVMWLQWGFLSAMDWGCCGGVWRVCGCLHWCCPTLQACCAITYASRLTCRSLPTHNFRLFTVTRTHQGGGGGGLLYPDTTVTTEWTGTAIRHLPYTRMWCLQCRVKTDKHVIRKNHLSQVQLAQWVQWSQFVLSSYINIAILKRMSLACVKTPVQIAPTEADQVNGVVWMAGTKAREVPQGGIQH